jgi:hypothetical protein
MYFIRASAVLWPPNEKTRNLVIALMFVCCWINTSVVGRRQSVCVGSELGEGCGEHIILSEDLQV